MCFKLWFNYLSWKDWVFIHFFWWGCSENLLILCFKLWFNYLSRKDWFLSLFLWWGWIENLLIFCDTALIYHKRCVSFYTLLLLLLVFFKHWLVFSFIGSKTYFFVLCFLGLYAKFVDILWCICILQYLICHEGCVSF